MTNLQRKTVLGIALSVTLLSVLVLTSLHAYASHDSIAVKNYGIKSSSVQSPSKHMISITGKIANFKGTQSKEPATIDISIHKWNQYKSGATYSIDGGIISTTSQTYKIGKGVMITHKSDEFLLLVNNERGQLLAKLHGYLNGGYKELQQDKPVTLLIERGSPLTLSNDGKRIPRLGTFIAESGSLNPVQ